MPGRICGRRRTFCTRCRGTGRRGRGEGGRQKAEGIHHRGTEGTEAGREEGRNEAGRRRRSWNVWCESEFDPGKVENSPALRRLRRSYEGAGEISRRLRRGVRSTHPF